MADRHAQFPQSGFVGRPAHRLFMVFDDPAAADESAEWLATRGIAGDQVWELAGLDGSRALDPTGRLEGPVRGRLVVLLRRALTGDIEYLELLRREVEGGAVVVAVAAERATAEQLAGSLAAFGARDLAYFGRWNFDPVRVEAA